MKKLLLALIVTTGLSAATPKKADRWTQLMTLVSQEMKILENARKKGPELNYRMLELHSEKLKLIHEKNNREFMEKAKTAKVDKESFFTETRAYYNLTKNFGHDLLKKFPSSSRRAEVLYALGLNSRDYGKDNIAEKYLLESISLIKDPHHSLRHHAETALADFYYNEKRFFDAITYYERAIKKTEDEWLTKHLFNLSWCYLKVREFDKAISKITESYFQSKNPAYINIKDQVLENIGSFYVYAGRPMDGLDFYLKNEKDPIPYLMPMAVKASDKGHEKETEEILDAAQKLVDKNNWLHYQEEIFHSYLDFYNHYKRFDDHEKTSRKLVGYYKKAIEDKELKLKTDMKEDAIEKMRTTAGFLQIKLAKDMKADEGQFKEKELDLVLNYFSHLILLDPNRKVEYYYFRAETYYSVRKFNEAAPHYVEAVNEAKRVKNNDHARKALNSLLALTGMEVLDKETNKKFLIFAYTEHVGLWPRDEKSELIYPKIFDIYREVQDDPKATGVLRAYNKNYPEHLKSQQEMMTKILDQFIDKKATAKLAHWINEFKTGFLSFSKDTIEKTEIVLGNILFVQYQEMAKKGDKLAAAKGFESIYVHKLYPDKVKWQSAMFAAMTYLELGETVNSYHWQALAYARMTEEEKLSRREDQLKMTERTYKLQDFKTSYKLADFLLKKFCSLKDDTQNRLYEVGVMTALVENKPTDAEAIVRQYSHCLKKAETREDSLAQIYQHYEKLGDFHALRLFVKRYSVEPYITQYRYTLQKWYWEKSSAQLKLNIREEFKALNHAETNQWLKEMDMFKQGLTKLEEIEQYVIWNKPSFDGEAYNKSLENYLVKVQNFKQTYTALTQSSQLDLAILSTRLFAQMYLHVGESIQNVRPQGMDSAMLKDFQGAMKQLSGQFLTASRQFNKQLDKAIKEKETLAWGSRTIASVEQVENPVFSFFTGLTMDKSRE